MVGVPAGRVKVGGVEVFQKADLNNRKMQSFYLFFTTEFALTYAADRPGEQPVEQPVMAGGCKGLNFELF
ncbi:MAG: hypothetical protein IT440_05510 [Phycisphaeraceae bacterium]|nr:hypothetical protein [Phycisphaeraceae bacterium]